MIQVILNIEDKKDSSGTKMWVTEVKKSVSHGEGLYAYAAKECMKAQVFPFIETYGKAIGTYGKALVEVSRGKQRSNSN